MVQRKKKTNTEKVKITREKKNDTEEVNPDTKVERVKIDTDAPIRWQKIGGGSFFLGRRRIKPNEKFKARPSEIPAMFRDSVIPLDEIPEKEAELLVEGIKTVYTLESVEVEGEEAPLFNVVNQSGKKINEKPLTKEIAESFLNDLQK